jgi:hypothetical protein
MTERGTWSDLREQRMSAPGAQDASDAARLAFELGAGSARPRAGAGPSSPSAPG